MNKFITKLAVLALGAASVMGVSSNDVGSIKASAAEGDTYEKLTSVSSIVSTAKYVFGLSAADRTAGELFQYGINASGNWGLTAPTTSQTPYYYTLVPSADGTTFQAYVNIDGTQTYLNIPTSKRKFQMGTDATSSLTAISLATVGTEEGCITNSTKGIYLKQNGTDGIRSYDNTSTTSTMWLVRFYRVVPATGLTDQQKANAYINRLKALITKGENLELTRADESAVNKIIAEFNGTDASDSLSTEVKALVVAAGYNDDTMTALLTSYNTSIAHELWVRIEALDPTTVTQSDETTINGFKTEYAALNEAQQGIIDGYGYVAAIAALDNALTAAFVGPVEALIEALPDASAITSEADWSLYDAAVTEAKTAYNELGDRQASVNQTLVDKLTAVIAAMDAVKPPLVEAMYEFSATANTVAGVVYPTGWAGTLEGYYGSLASYKAPGEYTQMDSLLDDNVKSISNLMVTVYAATNSASNASTLTVYGLNNGEIISGCSADITPVYRSLNTAALATTAANDNPRVVSLNSETLINGIRVECTTKGGNVSLIGISISYVEERYSAEYISLVADITAANTCSDYINATAYRTRYEALAADEQADFNAKVIKDEDGTGAEVEVTCGDKLAYMEMMLANGGGETPSNVAADNIKEKTPISLIILVAVLGLSAVAVYQFINKKKQQA